MTKRRLELLVVALGFAAHSTMVLAASPDFQAFLTNACQSADSASDFNTRCNVDAVDGDLSGDSEDSLNPTQSLANNANALAETRARIKALREKMEQKRDKQGASGIPTEESERDAMEVFQLSGFSVLINAESGQLDRDLTLLERGYETDSVKFQFGLDYRVTDDWIVGGMFGLDKYDTTYDADRPGRSFAPGNSEGDSEADSVVVSLFTSKVIADDYYIDALLSYSASDYTFERIGLFQEASRTLPTIAVETSADTHGNQIALSIGAGMDKSWGPNSLHLFGHVSYQKTSIDSYTERGGAGFAMAIANKDEQETVATLGVKFTRSINTSFGILVPQIFVEYEDAFDSESKNSSSRFIEDTSRTQFSVAGDEPDDSYSRAGFSILAGLPNGWSAFVNINRVYSQDHIDETRYTAGLRIEL